MKEKKNDMRKFAVISIILMISLMIGIIIYYGSLKVNLEETTCKTLDEVMRQEKNSFTRVLNTDKAALVGFAEMISEVSGDEGKLLQSLSAIQNNTDFEYALFAATDGSTINVKGEPGNVFDREYFQRALAGETVMSDPIKSKKRDDYIIAMATPIMQGGRTEGVLIGTITANKLDALFMDSFDGYGYAYITSNTGELVAQSKSKHSIGGMGNLFDFFGTAEFFKGDDNDTMRQNLEEGKTGHSQYRIQNQSRMMHYDKLPINDWNIFTMVNPEEVDVTAGRILKNTVLLTVGLVAAFVLLLAYSLLSKKRFTMELEKMAYLDDVTGCSSYAKFKLDAEELLQKNSDIHYMLIKMDIENFKLINEIYTMETGNQILKALADALTKSLDKKLDAFGRIHADEFALLIGYSNEEERIDKKQRFEDLFAQSTEAIFGFKPVLPRGRCKLQKGEINLQQSIENANFAHRLAKSNKVTDLMFDGKIKERAIREKEIERKMEDALKGEEFQLFLQPKYRLRDEVMTGAEALVRWMTGDEPVVYPGEFIPLFEQNGFITQLDLYMFEKTCKTLREWMDEGIEPFHISVNFSRLHLNMPSFVSNLVDMADRYNIPRELLEIELTETAMLENLEVLEGVLERLHAAGFTLSMDDFGTGYSSLGLLKDIPVDVIKIDKGFFDQSKDMVRAKTVITSVMDMARKLGIHTVAEGVETKEHIKLLKELGCETVQGYYYARPMPAQQLEVKLLQNKVAFSPET